MKPIKWKVSEDLEAEMGCGEVIITSKSSNQSIFAGGEEIENLIHALIAASDSLEYDSPDLTEFGYRLE